MSVSRPRRSTVIAAVVFVLTGVLYLAVRPEPRPTPAESPIPVFVVPTTTTTPPETTPPETTVTPATTFPPGATVAPDATDATVPQEEVPAETSPLSLDDTDNAVGSS